MNKIKSLKVGKFIKITNKNIDDFIKKFNEEHDITVADKKAVVKKVIEVFPNLSTLPYILKRFPNLTLTIGEAPMT